MEGVANKNETFRATCRRIIFKSDRPAEKLFDVVLIAAIALSVLVVMLDSVASVRARHRETLVMLEWTFTVLFTIEYALRLWVHERAARYARSFFGVVDLLAILPTYLSLIFVGTHYLMLFRILRLLRIFRVLKLTQYVGEANLLLKALALSSRKIAVFLSAVLTLVFVLGSVMYVVEGPENGFTSIPISIYWAIVTLTTVGYGDISPKTELGQVVASMVMIIGYGIIAVPTGIVTVELSKASKALEPRSTCGSCGFVAAGEDVRYCPRCGARAKSS